MPAGLKQRFFGDRDPPELTKDYDAIGFAADHCLIKYNMKVWLKHLVQTHLDELYETYKYPKEVKKFDYDRHMGAFMNCVVWDIENGTLIKLAGVKKLVTHALLGFRPLTEKEIEKMYGNPPEYKHLDYPKKTRQLENEKGAHMIFIGYNESYKVLIVSQVIDLMKKGKIKNKTYLQFAFDLNEVACSQMK